MRRKVSRYRTVPYGKKKLRFGTPHWHPDHEPNKSLARRQGKKEVEDELEAVMEEGEEEA